MITEVHQEGRFCRLSTSRAAHVENSKPHNPSTKDWCLPEDMEEDDYVMMNPAWEVIRKAPGKRMIGMRHWKKEQARRWTWTLLR